MKMRIKSFRLVLVLALVAVLSGCSVLNIMSKEETYTGTLSSFMIWANHDNGGMTSDISFDIRGDADEVIRAVATFEVRQIGDSDPFGLQHAKVYLLASTGGNTSVIWETAVSIGRNEWPVAHPLFADRNTKFKLRLEVANKNDRYPVEYKLDQFELKVKVRTSRW
jgi:uncharacterized protein YceK